ncbi:hypothetical protein NN561_012681 [Cricetulus griseus]
MSPAGRPRSGQGPTGPRSASGHAATQDPRASRLPARPARPAIRGRHRHHRCRLRPSSSKNGGIQTRGCSFWANLGHHRHPVYLTAKRPPPPLPRQHTQQSFRSLVVLPNPRGFPKPGLSARGVREGSLSGRSSAIENFGCTRLVNACEWGAPWSIRLNAPHQKHHRLEGDSAQMRMPRQGAGDWGNRGDQGCGSRWGLPRHPGSRQERILLPLPPPGAGTCRPRVCSKGDPPPAAHRSYLNQAAAPRQTSSPARVTRPSRSPPGLGIGLSPGAEKEPAGTRLRRSLRQEPGTARSEQPRTGRAGGAAAAPATPKGPGGSGSRARARARQQRPRRREAVVHFVRARQVGRGSRAGRGQEQGRGPLHVHRWPGEGVRAPRGEVGWSGGDISGCRHSFSSFSWPCRFGVGLKFKIKFKSALAGLRPYAQLPSLPCACGDGGPLRQSGRDPFGPHLLARAPKETGSGSRAEEDWERRLEPQRAAKCTQQGASRCWGRGPSPELPSWSSGSKPHTIPISRRDQRARMGAPWLKARGLSCESPAGHKLHLVCGTGRQPTLGSREEQCAELNEGLFLPSRRAGGLGAFDKAELRANRCPGSQ